jgi:hypothetical protein
VSCFSFSCFSMRQTEFHPPIRTGLAWWLMARSFYVWSIRKACASAGGALIGWWWGRDPFFLPATIHTHNFFYFHQILQMFAGFGFSCHSLFLKLSQSTYVPLILYSRQGSRYIWDIPPRRLQARTLYLISENFSRDDFVKMLSILMKLKCKAILTTLVIKV